MKVKRTTAVQMCLRMNCRDCILACVCPVVVFEVQLMLSECIGFIVQKDVCAEFDSRRLYFLIKCK